MGYIKSPLNYIGGKYKLLPQIIPFIKQSGCNGTFVDLFAGGANVCVNVDGFRRIIANDFEPHIINLYKCFQNNSIKSILEYINSKINEYNLSDTNTDGYNKLRNEYNKSYDKNSLDFFLLICYSFNHQFRFNSNGEFNMPFGKNRSKFNSNIERNLINFHNRIKEIIFTNKDFNELKIDKLNENDYVYCDPPYLITCATYNEKNGWSIDKEKSLLKMLDILNDNGIKFGLSNVLFSKGNTNDLLIDWSGKYNVNHLDYTYKNCNYHKKDKESKPDEVIITNY